MLCENVGYDPVKDISAVDPYGFVNLADAYERGSVPSIVNENVLNYNQIEDPASILGTPKDVFEGYRMMDAVRSLDKLAGKDGVTSDNGGE